MSADNVVELPRSRPLPRYGDAHIPAGEYDAVLVGCETWARCHGWAPRLVLVFTVADAEHLGAAIPGYYRVTRLDGRQRRNGRYQIGSRARLYRDLGRMLGYRPPTDRVPRELYGRLYRIIVRDVADDRDHHPLGPCRYSVVDWVRGPA